MLVIGSRINGARRWIELGPATFQPSELAKLALAVWASAYLCKRPAPRIAEASSARPIGLLSRSSACSSSPSRTSARRSRSSSCSSRCCSISGTPVPTLAAGTGIAVALGLVAIWFEPYRRARIFSFIDPWKDPQGAGFQTVQALISFGSGGFLGARARPRRRQDQLPARGAHRHDLRRDRRGARPARRDGVIAAYATFAYAGCASRSRCTDPFGKRLAAGHRRRSSAGRRRSTSPRSSGSLR